MPNKKNIRILALGAESAGVFAIYKNGDIFVSENFGDLLEEANFLKYKKAVLSYLKKEKVNLDVILTDLHPLFKTMAFGQDLAEKYRIPHIKVQHHIAHVFSSVGDKIIHNTKYMIPNTFTGIAMDGTGYGLDGNIWGGEVFRIKILNPKIQIPNKSQNPNSKIQILRIGSLEEQIMIGGDLAIKEPARMLVAIFAKSKDQNPKTKAINQNLKIIKTKNDIYLYVKKFYTRNEFELLYNQLEQGFNCQITTSAGRILDAVSVLLGYAGNERKFKHEATKLLEKNSTKPYNDLESRITNHESRKVLDTTYLFEYLLKNIKRDKKRLAATAQLYIARGFYKIVKNAQNTKYQIPNTYLAGGMANNKIISSYLEKRGVYPNTQKAPTVKPWIIDGLKSRGSKEGQGHTRMGVGVYLSKKIPRGDEGIAVGQIVYYLLNNH